MFEMTHSFFLKGASNRSLDELNRLTSAKKKTAKSSAIAISPEN